MSATMPRMLYGTAWKKESTTELVVRAVLNGFRGIDTACQPKHYREDLVGAALSELLTTHSIPRTSLYIQTKYTPISGQDTSQPLPYDPKASVEDQVEQSVRTSLRQLGVEWIDGLVLHSPLPTREQTLQALLHLRTLHSQSLIRSMGISNIYSPSLLRWLIKKLERDDAENGKGQGKGKGLGLGVVQNRWFEGNGWDWEILDICKENNIRYQSFWTLSGNPSLLSHPLLRQVAKKYSLTPEQAVYKFCISIGITPLNGTKSDKHMKEDLAVLVMEEEFTEEEVRGLRGLLSTNATSKRQRSSSLRQRKSQTQPLAPEETPLTLPEPKSMRYLLLENVTPQQILTTQLFSLINTSLSPTPSASGDPTAVANQITSLHSCLLSLSADYSHLLELTRKHQRKWEQLQRKRRKKEALEERVRGVMVGLERMGRELEGRNRVGKEVVEEIERSEKANISTETLLNYATRIAPYTSRVNPTSTNADPDPKRHLPTEELFYPVERVLGHSEGKLMMLGKGESLVRGGGEAGTIPMVMDGDVAAMEGLPPAIQGLQAAIPAEGAGGPGAAMTQGQPPSQARPQTAPQAKPLVPFNLDLGDDDSDADMDEVA